MGRSVPHSGQEVAIYAVEQCGQIPCVSKVSNGFRHLPHTQNAPWGGAVLQFGQRKPARRGALATFTNARACVSPPQQFSKIYTDMAPSQMPDCCVSGLKRSKADKPIKPATPMNPIMLVISRLLARPNGNQSRERKICPPSSG